MRIEYDLTRGMAVEAELGALERSPAACRALRSRLRITGLVGALLVLLALPADISGRPLIAIGAGVVLLLVSIPLGRLQRRALVERILAENWQSAPSLPVVLELTEQGLSMSYDGVLYRCPWSSIVEVAEEPQGIRMTAGGTGLRFGLPDKALPAGMTRAQALAHIQDLRKGVAQPA